ncbi:MAG: signal peptidase I [Desulfomonile tiedjei]|nr:signal peptidase I [Desulfomonile tiedjei]
MEARKRRYPIVALLLSLLVPGVGQMYNGQLARGVCLHAGVLLVWTVMGLTGLLYSFFGACVWLLCGVALWWVIIPLDAVLGSRRRREMPLKAYNRWYYYVIVIVAFALLADFLYQPINQIYVRHVRTFRVPISSMEPTLCVGDYFVTQINPYRSQSPSRNDVVVFPFPEDTSKMFVKRIVGLGGEKLEIRDKKLYVNDKVLDEPWAVHSSSVSLPRERSPRDGYGPVVVPSGAVFVMGDNRDHSLDSRFWGFLPWRDIQGKALYVYWSKDLKRIGDEVK